MKSIQLWHITFNEEYLYKKNTLLWLQNVFTWRSWNIQCGGHAYLLSIPFFEEAMRPKSIKPSLVVWFGWSSPLYTHATQLCSIGIFHSAGHLPGKGQGNRTGTLTVDFVGNPKLWRLSEHCRDPSCHHVGRGSLRTKPETRARELKTWWHHLGPWYGRN